MKRIATKSLVVILLIGLLTAYVGCKTNVLPDTGDENMEIGNFETADEAVKNMKCGWNLGNQLDCTGSWISGGASAYETAWGNPKITKELIQTVKAAGFNSVRVPVTWFENMDEDGNVDKDWMKRVHEVVNYVLNEGLYCIINVHHDNGGGDEAWLLGDQKLYDNGMKEKYIKLWTQIAKEFKNCDEKLLFAGLNETLDVSHNWNGSTAVSYSVINQLEQTFVDTVRSTGGNNTYRNLIVQTYGASSADSQVSGFVAPQDSVAKHIIAEVHIYDPSNFCGGTDLTWDSSDEKVIDTIFSRLNTKIIQKYKVPMIIGEFGSQDHTESDEDKLALRKERVKYAKYFTEKATAYGITCFWWDDGGSMSLFDRKNKTVLEEDIIKELVL